MANPILQLLEALRNMFTCDIGIDLGTANTLVYMKGRGIIIREPSVVAVDARTDELRVRCVGHEAKAIIGAAPNSILAVRPLKDGVIADFDITAAMLQSFIRQACGSFDFSYGIRTDKIQLKTQEKGGRRDHRDRAHHQIRRH